MIPKIPRAPINNKKMEDASNEHLPFFIIVLLTDSNS
jgi:hypothetical protein